MTSLRRRTYQGRALPHPGEELVDQGLAFDLGTLVSRRRTLRLLGLGVVGATGLAAAACSAADTDPGPTSPGPSGAASSGGSTGGASSDVSSGGASGTGSSELTEIPDETAGPYPADGSNGPDVLEQSGVVRSDITTSFGTSTTRAEGIPMTLTLTMLDLANGGDPFAGVAVYVWHCDRAGAYSLYSSGLENENYLRGVQLTDNSGQVTFTSIYPACYSGRWPHIHFEVYPDRASITDATAAICTSQVALPQNVNDLVYATSGYEQSATNAARVTLASDNVFGDDAGAHQLAAVTGSVSAGYRVSLTVPIDTATAPTGGSAPSGGGGPGGGPGSGAGGRPSVGPPSNPPS